MTILLNETNEMLFFVRFADETSLTLFATVKDYDFAASTRSYEVVHAEMTREREDSLVSTADFDTLFDALAHVADFLRSEYAASVYATDDEDEARFAASQ